MDIEVLWDGAYGLSSLSEKTRKSNHLQMLLQRQQQGVPLLFIGSLVTLLIEVFVRKDLTDFFEFLHPW